MFGGNGIGGSCGLLGLIQRLGGTALAGYGRLLPLKLALDVKLPPPPDDVVLPLGLAGPAEWAGWPRMAGDDISKLSLLRFSLIPGPRMLSRLLLAAVDERETEGMDNFWVGLLADGEMGGGDRVIGEPAK